ncbi:MAG: nitroreductase family deazaflavin-dependent oxidoreductase [Gordonia sp.]|uniref:Nitroreductase family deazaflavin-dependent oxidoreductase n=1 Tax=Gordonia rubripertincta TaxID=36822 RepID=A0ABT4N0N3_GORRU|nr:MULTISPECIES: nitroreductase family deazaflavin-dependent oxidoreductase [Mycobacteriales]MBA4023089.1 nitroreductase family deazaflavin-dependent oxidoreductase [Gordonia sp. (in: high G+C Gram-positive bacteria)]MCZ4552016.1 nitroreductase family deazaflavin-dependent oxidoreductase [Gordonia rubripertincta]OZG28093.1 nitroreductase [Williamsia sp. 1138]
MPTQEPPKALNSKAVSTIVKLSSRVNTKIYKLTGGKVGAKWRVGAGFKDPVPVILLTTIGRKSGKPRTVPLLFLRDGANVVVVASQGGMASNPAWYLNITANPDVSIQEGKKTSVMRAREADDAERERLWPKLVEVYADFDQYKAWTDRKIPVIICEPR